MAPLAWVYYSVRILYFGAEFTHAYAKVRGSRRAADGRRGAADGRDGAQQGIPKVEDVKATVKFIEEVRPELREDAKERG